MLVQEETPHQEAMDSRRLTHEPNRTDLIIKRCSIHVLMVKPDVVLY